jgi:UDP-N-acetylmuramate dehydrogenase
MITIQENIPLAPLTTFKIGGSARYFAAVMSDEDVMEALQYAKEHRLRVFVLGGGSNVLFSDAGFDGLIIKCENKEITASGTTVTVGAGAMLADVVSFAGKNGLAGIELMAGIPGSVGGATRGNAGAFGVEIGSLVTTVTFLDTKTLKAQTIAREDCEFSYRQSFFKKNTYLLVLSVELVLTQGNVEEIQRIAAETIAKREAKHPQNIACAGSFFMNPLVSNPKLLEEFAQDTGALSRDGKLPAGWLIDHVDLRGKRVGGAQVSDIHPNYIINTGNATAEDILILASIVKQRVRTQLGIELKEEAHLVGF